MNDASEKPENLVDAAFVEFFEAWFSEKPLDPDAFCQSHPECGQDLRDKIEAFLMVNEGLGEVGKKQEVAPRQPDESDLASGVILGDFKILREMGRGGMATVYEAEQISLNRKVALKILPSHLTISDQSVKKFYREAEAGGRQSHPGIVSIYAVGEQSGRHYIAQELVEGGFTLADKLNELRISKELPIGYSRVVARLIAKAAEALEHAHASSVIHRDVKPSNILLTKEGDPKVSDFGLAKVEDALSLSRTGDFAGTPYYMSPEQAMSQRIKIDHRTDIYSLGVTLYEMLTLKRPFEGKTSHEVLKKIVSLEPSDPRKQNPRVPRDLSIICLKAMEKNPEHRYQSMKAFSEDLRRFLSGEVILAKPAGLGTRFWKRVKRNPVLSAASGVAILAVLCLVGYILFVSYPRIKAEQERTANALKREVAAREEVEAQRAIAEEQRKTAEAEKQRALAAEKLAVQAKEEANQERERADEEAEKAKSEAKATNAVLDFLVGLFESSSPEETPGADITVKEVFDRGAEQITGEFEDQPIIRSRLLDTLGKVYLSLGEYSEAEPLFEEALELSRHTFGNDNSLTLASINNLANSYAYQGRYEEAEPLFLEALKGKRRVLGNDQLDTLNSINNLASLYLVQGHYKKAESLLLEALEGGRRVLGNDHPQTLGFINNLVVLYLNQGRYEKAEPLLLEALEGRRSKLGNDHPDTLNSINCLARLYVYQGRIKEAKPLLLEAVKEYRLVLGNDHPDMLGAIHGLAVIYKRQGRYEESELLFLEAVEGFRNVLDKDHPKTLDAIHGLAVLFQDQGRYEEAESLYLEALEGRRRVLGKDHPETLNSIHGLAIFYKRQGRYEKSESLFLEAVKEHRRVLGNDHPETLCTVHNLADLYLNQGRYEDAEPLFLEALEGFRRVFVKDHPYMLNSINNLTSLYQKQGCYKEAEPLAQELVEITPKDDANYNERKELLDQIREKLGKKESESQQSSDKNRPLLKSIPEEACRREV